MHFTPNKVNTRVCHSRCNITKRGRKRKRKKIKEKKKRIRSIFKIILRGIPLKERWRSLNYKFKIQLGNFNLHQFIISNLGYKKNS